MQSCPQCWFAHDAAHSFVMVRLMLVSVLFQTTAQDDGIYRIRIPIRESADGTVYVSTFTKAVSSSPLHLFVSIGMYI